MRYEDFISRFEKRRPSKNGVMVACPSHDDNPKTPSLSIGKAKDGGVLLKCFAGCTNQQVVESLGLKMKDLFAEEKAVKFTPPVRVASEDSNPAIKPVVEKIYSYRNAAGVELYQALRMKPKSFRQRHRNPDYVPGVSDQEWVWTMDGVERVLYNLPEILKAQTVVICEGEKDVENMMRLGFVATCNVGGAGKWLDGYTESLAGKDVILCGDNDEAGRKHMELVFDSIAGHAKTVRIVRLPESIKDASDFITGFKSDADARAALDELIGAAYPHIKGVKLPIYSIAETEESYKRFVRSMEKQSFPLSNWLPSLSKIRPLVPGELVFLIGDTGVGKTALLQNIALAAVPLPTLMFELELPQELMFERFASIATKFTGQQIEDAYRLAPDESIAPQIQAKYQKLFICPESRLTVEKIEAYITKAELKIGERPRVVLIDYIQLIAGSGPTRREKVSDIAEGLKVMAKATQTIVIVSSQISRPKDVDEDWEPSKHSAKESGSIEASCGVLISVWQDIKNGGLNMRVLKSTKGGAGTFLKCNFDGARMIINERSQMPDFESNTTYQPD